MNKQKKNAKEKVQNPDIDAETHVFTHIEIP